MNFDMSIPGSPEISSMLLPESKLYITGVSTLCYTYWRLKVVTWAFMSADVGAIVKSSNLLDF